MRQKGVNYIFIEWHRGRTVTFLSFKFEVAKKSGVTYAQNILAY